MISPRNTLSFAAWQMIASGVDLVVWTSEWGEKAFSSAEKVTWQTFPGAERFRQWNTGQFWTSPMAWSPNGRYLVTTGNIPGYWKYGTFVLKR